MDTYASSAGDPAGFYDIPALASAVDAFFVMEYSPNVTAPAQAGSPLTSSLFSDLTTAEQYAAAVPAAKVILGTPLFGIDWPTTGNTLTDTATGPATTQPDSQITGSGHPPVLGRRHQHGMDGVPSGQSVARDVLRRSDVAVPDRPTRSALRVGRCGRLGPGHGGNRPGHGQRLGRSPAGRPVRHPRRTIDHSPPGSGPCGGHSGDDVDHDRAPSGAGAFHHRDVRGRVPGHHCGRRAVRIRTGLWHPERDPLRGSHVVRTERRLRGTQPPPATSPTEQAGSSPPFQGATVVGLLRGLMVQNDAALSCLASDNQSAEVGASSAVSPTPELVVWQWPGSPQYYYVVATTAPGSTPADCVNATLAFPVPSPVG